MRHFPVLETHQIHTKIECLRGEIKKQRYDVQKLKNFKLGYNKTFISTA